MGKHLLKLSCLLSLGMLCFLFITPAAAADDDDPPSRVARLALTHGNVSFQPAGTDDWVTAVVNRPVTTGDKIWADNGARAEMHIGSASLRISDNTGFSFLNLNDNTTQIRLNEGTLRIRVKRLDPSESFEVDTPNLALSVLRPGIYRINVNEAGDTTVIRIRGGQAEVTGAGAAYNMHAWQIGTFTGTDELNPDIDNYRADDDDFDRWCADRDRHEDLSVSARYVSPDVIGYQDLDDYGGWRSTEYGMVWFPHVTVVGWAPYRYGHWAYIYPWGYTWVDDAPWGFAPFHYGRWVSVGGVWGWVPCPPPPPPGPAVVYVRPVYAPALVAWVGGPHFGVGIGVGVGWFPLGPREVFVPSYPVSRTYVNNVNVSNTTVNTTVINNYYVNRNTTVINNNVTNVRYVNQGVPGAVTATTHAAFTSAQPVSRNIVAINQREVAGASVNVTAPAVAPARQAVVGAGVASNYHPPAAVLNRTVVAKNTPPPPPPSFARQQQAIQANGGRPPAISQFHQMETANGQPAHANVRIAPAVTVQNPPAGRSGQTQANSGNPGGQPNNSGQPNNNGGYKPFGNNGNNNNPGNRNGNLQTNNGNANVNNNSGNKSGNLQTNSGNGNGYNNNSGNKPGNFQATNANGNNNGNNNNANRRTFDDRPPSSRPQQTDTGAPSQLDLKHQQQTEQLHNQQDQERQKLEQQQVHERSKLPQDNPSDQRVQQLNQKHQQQLEHLEQKHDNQEKSLHDKQQQEKQKDEKSAKQEHGR